MKKPTGIFDINGKEIVEGDIITCNTKGFSYPHRGVVEWHKKDNEFAIFVGENSKRKKIYTWFKYNENFLIVGNIND